MSDDDKKTVREGSLQLTIPLLMSSKIPKVIRRAIREFAAKDGQLLVASIGNPGSIYSRTRHNAGHLMIDELLPIAGPSLDSASIKGGSVVVTPNIVFFKSSAFMNESGRALDSFLQWYKKHSDFDGNSRKLLVVHDDFELEPGEVKFKAPSKAFGGHNGLSSILKHLGTDFARLRIGVGRPPGAEGSLSSNAVAKYVLGKMRSSELERLHESVEDAQEIIGMILSESDSRR